MKSKAMTYFLGLLVLSVWGLIIYKIFKATGGDDEPAPVAAHTEFKGTLNDYTIQKDTTKLLLNYRDPFSIKKAEPVEIPVSELIHKTNAPVVKKAAVNWGGIKYSGFIHNPKTKKLIAMLSINGKQLMMSEGETAEQVKLVKNMKDSVKLVYQGETKFVALNTKAL